MRVEAEEQRAGDFLPLAVQADRLGDRKNVPFVESLLERRAAMPGGAKRHLLSRHRRIGHLGVVGGDKPRNIDQHSGWRRLSGKRACYHSASFGGWFSSSAIFARRR